MAVKCRLRRCAGAVARHAHQAILRAPVKNTIMKRACSHGAHTARPVMFSGRRARAKTHHHAPASELACVSCVGTFSTLTLQTRPLLSRGSRSRSLSFRRASGGLGSLPSARVHPFSPRLLLLLRALALAHADCRARAALQTQDPPPPPHTHSATTTPTYRQYVQSRLQCPSACAPFTSTH